MIEEDAVQIVQKLFSSPFMIRVQMVFGGLQKSGQLATLDFPNAIRSTINYLFDLLPFFFLGKLVS